MKNKPKKRIKECPNCGNELELMYRKAKRCIYCQAAIVWQGERVKLLSWDHEGSTYEENYGN